MKILITGLSGSGKTFLTSELTKFIPHVFIFNGDFVREVYKDNDFSLEGRLVQARRMSKLALGHTESNIIFDFICPTEETRRIINADYVIFMSTIKNSQYADTDALYEIPRKADIVVITKDAVGWARIIKVDLSRKFPELFDIPPKT